MKRLVSVVFFIAIANLAGGQQKELTLEDAVMQQYRNFYPDALTMFIWIPNTDCYVYLDGYQKLMKASMRNTEAKELLTIQDVNQQTGAELYWFSGMEWKNENEFWLNDGKKYYTYDLVSDTGRLVHFLEDDAENALFHGGTENIAYTRSNNVYVRTGTGQKMVVTDFADKNVVSGQAIARSEFGITNGLFWAPNGKKLAFYQKDETDVQDYPLLDINETPGTLNSIKYPMAGQKSEKPRVGIYNLETKQTVYISPRNASDDYLTNLSWTPNNKYVVIAEVNRDQDHMWLNVYSAENGKFIRTLFEETSKTWTEPEHPAFFPLENSNNFVWISERDGFNNLYYYDFEGNLIKKLTDHDFVVKDIMEYNNGNIYYTTTGEDARETHVYYVSLNGKGGIITRAQGTHTVHISDDGKYFHDHFSSTEMPSADWILRKNGTIIEKLQEAEDKLMDYELGDAELGYIKREDGTKLYHRLIKPSDFDARKKYPVLVYVYGGPHAQLVTDSWLEGASLWMYWMAEQGYLVYTLDGRGSAERGVAFESIIHRQLGNAEIEDQMLGVEYLKGLSYVDSNRLAIHGWSYGGFMTTSLMLRQPGIFNCGVAGGPVTDWKYYEIMYGERYMDRPDQNEKGYEKACLMTHAGNLEGDLLLIHGTVDDVVVMQHNLALVKKFIELGKQIDFFPYPMHKHNVRGKDRVHLMEKVLTYVIEHNK